MVMKSKKADLVILISVLNFVCYKIRSQEASQPRAADQQAQGRQLHPQDSDRGGQSKQPSQQVQQKGNLIYFVYITNVL